VPPIAHILVRKTLVAERWTCCEACRRERRNGIAVMAVTLPLWPVLWLWAVNDDTLARSTTLDGMVLLSIALVPLGLLLGFGYRISQLRMVGGTLSPDGSVLSLPVSTFPAQVATGAGRVQGATGGQTFLPQW
jgi:hypothetical protein